MKVNIYSVDYDNEKKGDLIGIVKYIGGKVHIDAEDQKIEEIIHKKILSGRKKNRNAKNTMYFISAPEFVQLLGIECWKNGYVAEIIG